MIKHNPLAATSMTRPRMNSNCNKRFIKKIEQWSLDMLIIWLCNKAGYQISLYKVIKYTIALCNSLHSLYFWIINWSHTNGKKIIINFILENIRRMLRSYLFLLMLACEYSIQNRSLPCMTMPKKIPRIYLRNTMPSLCSCTIQKHSFIVTRRCHFY